MIALGVWGALAPDGGPPLRSSARRPRARWRHQGPVRPRGPAFSRLRRRGAHDDAGAQAGRPRALAGGRGGARSAAAELAGVGPARPGSPGAFTRRCWRGSPVPAGATRFRNEIVAYSPSGRIVAVFEKVHRVPFGEYVPWRSFFSHLVNLQGVPKDAVAGHGSRDDGDAGGRCRRARVLRGLLPRPRALGCEGRRPAHLSCRRTPPPTRASRPPPRRSRPPACRRSRKDVTCCRRRRPATRPSSTTDGNVLQLIAAVSPDGAASHRPASRRRDLLHALRRCADTGGGALRGRLELGARHWLGAGAEHLLTGARR